MYIRKRKRWFFISIILENRINSYSDNFSALERHVASYLLNHANVACLMSIQELAAACDTSISTISRFAKKIGCQNFQGLRMLLSNSVQVNAQTFFKSVNKDDSLLDIAKSHFYTGASSLSATQAGLSEEQLFSATEILRKANMCGLFGFGGSGVVTLNAYHRFIRSSLSCLYAQDFHMQLMNAAKLSKNDAAIIVSHTGKNRDILQIVEILKESEVPIISITSGVASPLVAESEVSFISISEETEYRPEAITSLVSQMSIMDSLFMIYALKVDGDTEYFAKIRRIINDTRDKGKRK